MSQTEAVNQFFKDVLKNADDIGDLDPTDLTEEVLEVIQMNPDGDTTDLPAELAAMQAIVTALDGLSSSASGRVLQWASQRFGGDYY